MKHTTMRNLRPFLTACILTVLTTIGLSGCLGGCTDIPPIEIPITIAENITLPQALIDLGAGVPFDDFEIMDSFPPYCDLPTQDEIDQMVEDAVGAYIAGLVHLDSVIIKEVRFEASVGNFSAIDNLALDIRVNGEDVNLGSGGYSAQEPTVISLTVAEPPNLIDLLFGEDTENCVQPIAHITGEVPAQNITFTVKMTLEVEVSVG